MMRRLSAAIDGTMSPLVLCFIPFYSTVLPVRPTRSSLETRADHYGPNGLARTSLTMRITIGCYFAPTAAVVCGSSLKLPKQRHVSSLDPLKNHTSMDAVSPRHVAQLERLSGTIWDTGHGKQW